MHVPAKVKRAYRRSKKAKDRQALRRGDEPERDRMTHRWDYL